MSKICSFGIEDGKVGVARVFASRLRFRCIRCAKLCCKLGGPRLTKNDIVGLEKAGFRIDQISDSRRVLKTKPSGECIFLRFDENDSQYECEIHEHKPLLCKAFPFAVEPESVNGQYELVALPCRGLSMSRGRRVSKGFIQNTLSPILLTLVRERIEF